MRKYLLRQAMTAKLDREPGVLLDLLRSREQILENAYLQRTAASKAPGKADVDKYIASNPAKFGGTSSLRLVKSPLRRFALACAFCEVARSRRAC